MFTAGLILHTGCPTLNVRLQTKPMAAPWCAAGVRGVLLALGECLPDRPGTCNLLCTGATMNLRLIEQACGCSLENRRQTQGACSLLPLSLV